MDWNFALGAAVGAGIVLLIIRCVKVAVEKERARADGLREENMRLRAENNNLISARDCADAYRKGKREGREDPMTRAERFAKTFENRRVQFGGERRTA